MTVSLAVLASPLWRGLRFGSFRLTAYGVCAALGLLSGMSLAGRAARRSGLDADAAWDAGLVAVVGCFLASRLLLIFGDPAAFRRYPLLVLELPSLTVGGMGLAALIVLAYLRVKKLPLLRMLDVFAAPGAALAAWLEAGHWMDGSEPGMPLRRPWSLAFQASEHTGVIDLHPVALYGVGFSVLLAGLLWVSPKFAAGQLAALALFAGGLGAFGLDMLTQPSALSPGRLLEPGQTMALGAMLAGALLWALAPQGAEAYRMRARVTGPGMEPTGSGTESPKEVS